MISEPENKILRKYVPDEYDQLVQLQICWILDITGSMSSSIEACKKASAAAANIISDQGLNVGFVMSTYTEDSKGSYVSYDRFSKVDEAVKFINSIKLCVPPRFPNVNASGDDGEENLKLAMADFSSRHNFDIPSVVFIITDADYHSKGSGSKTAKHEQSELKKLNIEDDLFKIWSTFDQNNTFVFPLLVSIPSKMSEYGRLANDSDGILLKFKQLSGDGSQMAKVQVCMVNEIFKRLSGTEEIGDVNDKFENLIGLVDIYDCSSLNRKESEFMSSQGSHVLISGNQEITTFFNTQMEKLVKVVGKGWKKRSIHFDVQSITAQFNLMIYAFKYFLGQNQYREEIEKCLELVRKHTPEEQQRHIQLTMAQIDEIKSGIEHGQTQDMDVDAITKETFKEYAEETSVDEIKVDFVSGVAGGFYGLPVDIKFPLDVSGKVDFMSAWDAVVSRVGIDVSSLKSFVELVQNVGDGDATAGLTDGHGYYNALIILSGEAGSLRWAFFKTASSLQVLDCAMSLSVGAPMGQAIPNMHPGLISVCLMQMIKPQLTKSTFDRLCDILNTLRAIAQNSPRGTSETLRIGQANPHEPIGKLITVWYRNGHDQKMLKMIVREFMTYLIQRHFKKPTPETNKAYNEYIAQFFDSNMISNLAEEPIDEIHPIESSDFTEKLLELYLFNPNAEKFKKDEQLADICQGISEQIMKKIQEGSLFERLRETDIYKTFRKDATNLWTVLNTITSKKQRSSNPDMPEVPELVDLDVVYPEHMQDYLESLLIRFRRERYLQTKEVIQFGEECNLAPETFTAEDKAHYTSMQSIIRNLESVEVDPGFILKTKQTPVQVTIYKFLREVNAEQAKIRREKRVASAKEEFINKVRQHGLDNPNLDSNEWAVYLESLKVTIDGTEYLVGRTQIALMEEFYVKPYKKMIGAVLCLKWGREVPSNLKKSIVQIEKNMIDNGYKQEAISLVIKTIGSVALCIRPSPPNRHGHSKNLTYPGPLNWTLNYENTRLLTFKDKKQYLTQMKRYTFTAIQWQDLALSISNGALEVVNTYLYKYQDANCLENVKKKSLKKGITLSQSLTNDQLTGY